MVNATACTIELWMHVGGCEARKKRKTLANRVLSKPPKYIHNSIVYAMAFIICFKAQLYSRFLHFLCITTARVEVTL